MKKGYSHIAFILDRSGSMELVKNDTIGGFNRFLNDQKKIKGNCTVSLHQFDDRFETVYETVDINHVSELTDKTFVPRGWTRLLDALGKTINSLGEKLSSMKEGDRPEKIIVITFTDGQENNSKEFNQNQIKQMIEHQKDKYNWQFMFLGANQDAIFTAKSYGINQDSALTYASNSVGTRSAFLSASSNVLKYRVGTKMCASFEKEDRDSQEKELVK